MKMESGWAYPWDADPSARTRPPVCLVPESPYTSLRPDLIAAPLPVAPEDRGARRATCCYTPEVASCLGSGEADRWTLASRSSTTATPAWTSTRPPSGPAVAGSVPRCRRGRGPALPDHHRRPAPTRRLAGGRGGHDVAMESTGVYWKPVFNLLEGRFEVILVNAQHIKKVPGRKTDVKDAEWIAQLLQHGLLSASFVPPPPIRELRDLTRQRTQLVRERAGGVNRHPEGAGGRQHQAGQRGQRRAGGLGPGHDRGLESAGRRPGGAGRAGPQAAAPEDPRAEARRCDGRATDHHRFLLRMLLEQVEHLEGLIARPERPDRGGDGRPFAAAAAAAGDDPRGRAPRRPR